MKFSLRARDARSAHMYTLFQWYIYHRFYGLNFIYLYISQSRTRGVIVHYASAPLRRAMYVTRACRMRALPRACEGRACAGTSRREISVQNTTEGDGHADYRLLESGSRARVAHVTRHVRDVRVVRECAVVYARA